ncbi:MAG TPA: hypothetical protein VG299_09400, partial [Candidatus Dormibacteraeota bacterium]|nr:hypothetical protein [Candidatus Dormibacteraeota bacterium]
MAEDAVAGPAREADFAHQLGSDPGRGFGGPGGDVDRARLHLERAETISQVAKGLLVETGAHLAAVNESSAVEHREDESAKLVQPASPAGGVSDDDARLAAPRLDLHP